MDLQGVFYLIGVTDADLKEVFVQMRYSIVRLLYVMLLISVLLSVFRRPLGIFVSYMMSDWWDTPAFLHSFTTFSWLAGYDEAPWDNLVGKCETKWDGGPPKHEVSFLLGVLLQLVVWAVLAFVTLIFTGTIWSATAIKPESKSDPLDWQI